MNGLVPQKWHEVFGKVLAKRPDDRYQTATEFVQDLEYCLGSWFGAVADMTLAEPAVPETIAGAPVPSAARKTGPQAPVPVDRRDDGPAGPVGRAGHEATIAMPRPTCARGAGPAPMTTLVETSPEPPAMEGTVVMPVPAAALAGRAPSSMAAPVVPPRGLDAGEGTVVMAAAPPAPQMEGTLVMEAPVRVPPRPRPMPRARWSCRPRSRLPRTAPW